MRTLVLLASFKCASLLGNRIFGYGAVVQIISTSLAVQYNTGRISHYSNDIIGNLQFMYMYNYSISRFSTEIVPVLNSTKYSTVPSRKAFCRTPGLNWTALVSDKGTNTVDYPRMPRVHVVPVIIHSKGRPYVCDSLLYSDLFNQS